MKKLTKYLSFRKEYKNLKKEIVSETKKEFANPEVEKKKEIRRKRHKLVENIRNTYASFVFDFKIRFSFFRNNKFKILVNFILLFISSLLFFFIFTIPSVLVSYSYSVFHIFAPYVSQIKYTTNPGNSAHVNQVNTGTSVEKWIKNAELMLPENPCFNNSSDLNCQRMSVLPDNKWYLDKKSPYVTTPVYGLFNPNDQNHRFQKYIPLGSAPDSSLITNIATYLGGVAINNQWIEGVKNFFAEKPEYSGLVCQVVGESGTDAGKCILNAISKEIPYYIRDRIVNPQGQLNNKFSLLFGRIPYDPSVSELFTYLNGSISALHQDKSISSNIEVWGIKENSRLNFLKSFNISPHDRYNPNGETWDVAINKAAAHALGLDFTHQYPQFKFYPQIPVVNKTGELANFTFFHTNIVSNNPEASDFDKFKMCVKNPGGISDCTAANQAAVNTNGYFQYGWGYDSPDKDVPRKTKNSLVSLIREKQFDISNLNNPQPITLNIKGVVNQPGQPIIYAPQKDVNYTFLYQANQNLNAAQQGLSTSNPTDPRQLIWKVFGDEYFNGKLSSLSDPLDLTNFTIANSYGDYSQPTLTGGRFYSWYDDTQKTKTIYYTNNIKSVIGSIFSPLIFKQTVLRLILSLFFLFFVLGLIVFIISSIIMSSTSNMAILQGRKTITVMKTLGYSNIEVSKLSTGFLFWIFIASFIFATIVYIVALYFILNKIFIITDLFLPVTFTFWTIPSTFIVMLLIYGITKWISFKSITKTSSQEIFST